MAGFLRGISKNREAELLRIRNFTIFSLAVTHATSKQQTTGNQVSNVRDVDERPRNKNE